MRPPLLPPTVLHAVYDPAIVTEISATLPPPPLDQSKELAAEVQNFILSDGRGAETDPMVISLGEEGGKSAPSPRVLNERFSHPTRRGIFEDQHPPLGRLAIRALGPEGASLPEVTTPPSLTMQVDISPLLSLSLREGTRGERGGDSVPEVQEFHRMMSLEKKKTLFEHF